MRVAGPMKASAAAGTQGAHAYPALFCIHVKILLPRSPFSAVHGPHLCLPTKWGFFPFHLCWEVFHIELEVSCVQMELMHVGVRVYIFISMYYLQNE